MYAVIDELKSCRDMSFPIKKPLRMNSLNITISMTGIFPLSLLIL